MEIISSIFGTFLTFLKFLFFSANDHNFVQDFGNERRIDQDIELNLARF